MNSLNQAPEPDFRCYVRIQFDFPAKTYPKERTIERLSSTFSANGGDDFYPPFLKLHFCRLAI